MLNPALLLVVASLSVAAPVFARANGVGECAAPFEMPRSLSEVQREVELSQKRLQRARKYEREYPEQMSAEALSWSVRHAEWLLTYHQTLNLVFRSGDAREIEQNLEKLRDTLDHHSDVEGYRLLDLYRYLGELSNLAVSLDATTFDLIMANIESEIDAARADPTNNPMTWQRKLLQFHLYKLQFAKALYRPGDVASAYQAIVELVDDGVSLPTPYLQYLDGFAAMTTGLLQGDKSRLLDSTQAFAKALEVYGIGCAPRMATLTAYYLAGAYHELAIHHADRPENQSHLRSALDAAMRARAYASLLDAPDEWRAVHWRSGEIFESASKHLLTPEDDRQAFLFLARRSFELATSF